MSVDWKNLFRRYGGVSKEADIRISGYLIRPDCLTRDRIRWNDESAARIIADCEKIAEAMKQISINNGATYTTPAEALEEISLDTMAEYMDNDTREAVHNELAPCSDIEFLERYLELAPDDLIVG